MVGSIWLEGMISQQSQIDERSAMEQATAIATEAVVSIKTVQSLGKTDCETERPWMLLAYIWNVLSRAITLRCLLMAYYF